MLSRRGLITGLISLAAAPAIVRASSLMPIKVMVDPCELLHSRLNEAYAVTRESMLRVLYSGYEFTANGRDDVLHWRPVGPLELLIPNGR